MATITEALTIALDLHLAGKLGEAQDLYSRILDVDPEQPDALHFLGVLAGQIGQPEVGQPLIARALGVRPDAADIHANHANLLRMLKRPQAAMTAYRHAIALRPDFAEAWVDFATVCRENGNADGAITALNRATRSNTGLAVAQERLLLQLHERGRLRLESGNALAALPDLFRASELAPFNADLAFLLGNALYATGLRRDSVSAYRLAIALVPDFHSAAFNLGIALGKIDLLERAASALRMAARIDPTHLDALDKLTITLCALNQEDEANVWAEALLDLKNRLALADAPKKIALPAQPQDPERRNRQVIAFSLWGTDELYTKGAVANAHLTRSLFPGWECRIYHDNSVPVPVLDELTAAGADLVTMPPDSGPTMGPYWRFFAANDPTVTLFLCRDCDSRLSAKEVLAVEAWIRSGYPFHIMRDHVLHTELIMAGMWGGRAGLLPDLSALAERFARSTADRWQDQRFLRRWVWPLIRNHALIHDRTHHRHGIAFPDGPNGPLPDRIGSRIAPP
ncbi:tetratricopeptide repeat protein [Azospirillum griseum]|uniref:Tetratricopeptide repeat protein n=1 Tax=Azospirillum griseum TaxID=2496639 RepID=A0A431VKT4_9PROT|nr:tetratricopeptide repeat protein [Azospirillum griseum]RTR22484.1 tetratricopeptide repeat protein [Azospirillum griseum]